MPGAVQAASKVADNKASHKATASLLRRAAREARIGMPPTELTSLLPRRAERDDNRNARQFSAKASAPPSPLQNIACRRRQGLARLIEGSDFRRKIEAIAKPPDSLVEVVILGAPQIFA